MSGLHENRGRSIDRESVFEEVLVAIVETPRSTGEIVEAVRVSMGCIVPVAAVVSALERAAERGAAVIVEKRFASGHMRRLWREPVDALSEGMRSRNTDPIVHEDQDRGGAEDRTSTAPREEGACDA